MQTKHTNESIDVYRIVEFLASGWKTICLTMVIGGVAGITIALILPMRFQSSVAISGGSVQGKELETIGALAERMRSPTFYSDKTIEVCQESANSDPADAVERMLAPTVPKESTSLVVVARMKNVRQANDCLQAVLQDVRNSQSNLFNLLKNSSQSELDQLKSEMARRENLRNEELALLTNQLEVSQNKLAETEKFLEEHPLDERTFDISDQRFPASSLLLSVLAEKEQESLKLRDKILGIQSRIRAKMGLPETEKLISEMKLKIITLETKLKPPMTKEADFSTPIFNSKNKAEPRRSLITLGGLAIGGILGLLLLLVRQFLIDYRRWLARPR